MRSNILTQRHLLRLFGTAALFGIGAHSASAALITRQANVMLTATPDGPNNTYGLDLNQDGVPDFTFETIIGDPTDPSFGSFAVVNVPFASINGEVVDASTTDGFPTISNLKTGAVVGNASTFSGVNDQGNLFFIDAFDPASGNFNNASGYVGLRFASGSDTLYGFAYVTVNGLYAPQNPLALTIGQVGYETVPGRAVTLPPVSVPEPATASIAGAAAMMLSTRRRRALGTDVSSEQPKPPAEAC